ncbi:MAG TPA: two-component regulator propeller domain-containing protein [Puia sp.]
MQSVNFFHGLSVWMLVWLAYVVPNVSAQAPVSLHFESYTINDGLSQGFISAILQDRKGFMWFGTSDGLNKYDGYSFTVFRHHPGDPQSLAGDDISCLHEDGQQRLWIGFKGKGIDIFDVVHQRYRHIRQSPGNGLRSDFVLGIYEDRQHFFWVRSRAGIDRLEYRGDSIVAMPIPLDSVTEEQRSKIGVETLLIDSRNRKFVTTTSAVMELVYEENLRKYLPIVRFRFTPASPAFLGALKEDTLNHCLYLNTGNTVYKFPDYNFGRARVISFYNASDIRWTIDNRYNLWLMDQQSIRWLNTRRNQQRRVVPDAPDHRLVLQAPTVFYTDRTGVVWLGSGGYGLLKYDPATAGFHHSLRGSNIYQLIENKDGKIITNTLNALELTDDSLRVLPGPVDSVGMNGNNMSFTRDTAGCLWYSRSGALLRYDPAARRMRRIPIPYPELSSQPFPLMGDKGSSIWMGYSRYLVRYNWLNNTFSRYSYPDKELQYDYDYLQSMFEDEELLWLGSVNGLYCFDKRQEKIVHVYRNDEKDSSSISANVALSFCPDMEEPERYLWVGTKGGGLNRLDKRTGRFIHYTTRQGLANNVVYGILPDYDGHLWLSTNKGLSVFHTPTGTFRNFDVSDGLQSNEFNRYAYLRTSDGIMIFGGLNGINYFREDEIHALPPPQVVFTDFRLFNRSVLPGRPGSPLTKAIDATASIELRYDQNIVTFQFAALDYRKKGSINYRYRMEGFDKDWLYPEQAHEATYTNLDPGNYRFVVQASFENGSWSEESASVRLHVITPWYRTWWFYSLTAAVLIGLAYSFYRFRLYQLRRLDKLRNRIAMDLHDEVGSSISTIAIYSKIAHDHLGDATFDKEQLLKKINDFATDIMTSMNDIVWSINTKNDAFEHIISHMREHATQLLEAKGHDLHFSVDEKLLRFSLGMERRREFYLIYKEALNNIAKYAGTCHVWISLVAGENNITLRIRDDGSGFDPALVKSSGNGLANMRQRAASLHGSISISSAVGSGTEIVLTITPF